MQDIIQRLRTKKGDEGFTLIELLVVVVIIGVLVAIAVPVYLNYRKGAADKSAQSDVRGAISTIEQFYTDNNNSYPTTNFANQQASFSLYGTSGTASGTSSNSGGWITLSDKTTLSFIATGVSNGSNSSYKVCATNAGGSNKVYYYDSTQGGSVKAGVVSNVATCS
jgi:type IV pilus assembly protein PilA